jgi:hypothetical protein
LPIAIHKLKLQAKKASLKLSLLKKGFCTDQAAHLPSDTRLLPALIKLLTAAATKNAEVAPMRAAVALVAGSRVKAAGDGSSGAACCATAICAQTNALVWRKHANKRAHVKAQRAP